jgi:hypothetical protein
MRSELADDSPRGLRARLHVARARLVQLRAAIPAGRVEWTDPLAVDVQLCELLWGSLSDAERLEGERAFRSAHGRCVLPRCPWVAQTTPRRS